MVDRSVIISNMLALISSKYDTSEGSIIRDMLMPMAIAAEDLTVEIDEVSENAMADTAVGEWLTDLASEHGVFRQGATNARGQVTFFGETGTQIPLGTYVKSDISQYATLSSAVIGDSGDVTVEIISTVPGSIGNCKAGFVNSLNINIDGVVKIANEHDISGGVDEESDELLRKRFFYHVSRPIYAGNVAHYVQWAENASDEVGIAKCIPVWNGGGTVKVIFVTDTKTLPDAELISKVEENIRYNMPCAGVDLTVEAPTEKRISVGITVDSEVPESVQEKVKNEIDAYFREVALSENSVKYSRICAAVLAAEGLGNFTSLKVNDEYSNVGLLETEIPVLSDVIFTVGEGEDI